MPALPVSQQSDWNSNVYSLAITRIFVVIGVAYLIRSLYFLMSSMWDTRSASIAAVSDAISLGDITTDNQVTLPGVAGTGPDLEASLTVEIGPPQPSYDPQNHAARSRANTRAQNQDIDVPGSPTAALAMQHRDVGVRIDDLHTERGMDIAMGPTG